MFACVRLLLLSNPKQTLRVGIRGTAVTVRAASTRICSVIPPLQTEADASVWATGTTAAARPRMFACVRLLLLTNPKRSLRVEQRDTEAPTAEPPVVTLPQQFMNAGQSTHEMQFTRRKAQFKGRCRTQRPFLCNPFNSCLSFPRPYVKLMQIQGGASPRQERCDEDGRRKESL